jgi:putative oxidoreductase
MNTNTLPSARAARATGLCAWIDRFVALMQRIPDSGISLLARFSLAAIFWKSGQTKVENFALDLIGGEIHLGLPRLADSALALFRTEYRLPLIAPEPAALLAAGAEHLFPVLLLLGLATRLSATALLVMTLVIQVFVYPDAYPTHGVWATALLFLMAKGAGRFSLDRLLASYRNRMENKSRVDHRPESRG